MSEIKEVLPEMTEFESKYRLESHQLIDFKRLVENLPGLESFLYIEGPDQYFTNHHTIEAFTQFAETLKPDSKADLLKIVGQAFEYNPLFIRYRKPSHGLDNGRAELTTKYLAPGKKNNINREEENLRVDKTKEAALLKFVERMGFRLNFIISKTCQIYKFKDATIVFYTVFDTTTGKVTKADTFVEIEVDEELTSTLTESEAWEVLVKYEKALSPLGINPQKRLRKSLFDLYRRS